MHGSVGTDGCYLILTLSALVFFKIDMNFIADLTMLKFNEDRWSPLSWAATALLNTASVPVRHSLHCVLQL